MVEALMIPEFVSDPAVEAAERALDETRVIAGGQYHRTLKDLGLEPDVLCWVYEADRNELQLAIVTSMAERIDGLSIYKLLFRAYEAAATPREIDPLIVSIYGPRSDFGATLRRHLGALAQRGTFSTPQRAALFAMTNAGASGRLVVLGKGVYAASEGHRSAAEDLKRFQRFQRRVRALAA